MKCWVGIDPGAKGCIAVLFEDGSVQFMDTDEHLSTILDFLREIDMEHNLSMCMIEDVHSIFGASAKSNFQFGFNVGTLHGIFKGIQLPLDTVQPKVWQKHIGVKATVKGKEIKIAVAEIICSLYPKSISDLYTPKKRLLDGRTDALAIAAYCKFKHT